MKLVLFDEDRAVLLDLIRASAGLLKETSVVQTPEALYAWRTLRTATSDACDMLLEE